MDPVSVEDDYSCSDDGLETDDREENEILHSSGTFDYQHPIVLYQNFDSVCGRTLQRQKTRRRRWTQRDMTNAYNAVKYQGMSLRGAATAFNVPESTLRDRVHGRVSLECSRPGPPTFFTYDEEKKMVDHILFMSKIGYPYTRNQVVELAGDMTKAVGRIAPFKYINPSQAWFYAFLNRWPDLKNFLFGPRSNRKSKGVSGDSIQSYFEQLEKVLLKYDIKDKPEHFWVVDEISISCENQPPRILPISIQRAQSVSYWNPTVAMIGAANGIGEKIPPFLIYRGDCITPSMMEGSVRGTKFSYSSSGWVNSDAFIQWFLKHFRLLVLRRPLVLFYDGHLQFVSVRVLERAREDDVFLFPLPPHPAYNHCVENTCFWAFQVYFKKRLDRFFEKTPNQPLLRNNVAPILTHAYEKALQPSNVIQLFERLGICPFNNLAASIGAYLNMPEDYDQMASENVDPHINFDGYSSQNIWGQVAGLQNYVNTAQLQTNLFLNGDIREHNLCESVTSDSSNLLRAPAQNPKSQSAVVTGVSSSGRSVTIRLHGPAAGAIQPLGRSVHPVVVTSSGSATTVPVPRASIEIPQDTLSHTDVDVACEEEIGFEVPSLQSAVSLRSRPEVESGIEHHNLIEASEFMEEIEDGEAPDFCVVCGQLEPPESACQPASEPGATDDLQVVDWVHCDYCDRWVHWNGSCSEGALIGDNSFMCIVCRHDGTAGGRDNKPIANSTAPPPPTTNTVNSSAAPPM